MREKSNKKQNEFYFPVEVNMFYTESMSKLLIDKGVKGIGIYMIILSELRRSSDYSNGLLSLKLLAKRFNISIKQLEDVIFNYGLFDVKEEKDEQIISSPYMDRVMNAYNERRAKYAKTGKINSNKSKRNSKGQFTVNDPVLEQEQEQEHTSTAVEVEDGNCCPYSVSDVEKVPVVSLQWEEYVNQAFADESWSEILAMKSGMGKNFLIHREWLIEQFKQHATLQGKGETIRSLYDAKSYLANFFRQGTVTQKRLLEELKSRQQDEHLESPYRFETVDPQTGERTYFGNKIPQHAPPRPNNNAVWIEAESKWM